MEIIKKFLKSIIELPSPNYYNSIKQVLCHTYMTYNKVKRFQGDLEKV